MTDREKAIHLINDLQPHVGRMEESIAVVLEFMWEVREGGRKDSLTPAK